MRGTKARQRPKDDDQLIKCKQSGLYNLNGSQFRFMQGDKMPKGATLIENVPVHPGGRAAEKFAARSERNSRPKGRGRGPAPADPAT